MRRLTYGECKAGWVAIGPKPAADALNGRIGARSCGSIPGNQTSLRFVKPSPVHVGEGV